MRSTDSSLLMPFGDVGGEVAFGGPPPRSRARGLSAGLSAALRGDNSLLKCALRLWLCQAACRINSRLCLYAHVR